MKKYFCEALRYRWVSTEFFRSGAAIVAPQVLPTFPERKVGRIEA